ncbi:MAG: serine acetyltransferase [Myxococcota bacterium]|nr:serine acetyltransferase [Myxococcota bacterium]
MRVVLEITRDTLAIARILHGERVGLRQVATILAHDGAQALALSRLRQAARRWRIPLAEPLLRRAQLIMFGIDIGRDVELGEGVLFAHTVGIVIGGDARVGDRVMFLGSNTIGSIRHEDFPRVGSDVIIGAGARIVGAVTIGDGATIGANAVVVHDVPPAVTAIGVPAFVHDRRIRKGAGYNGEPGG